MALCQVKTRFCTDLERLQENHTITLLLDPERSLRLRVNGTDQGEAVKNIPEPCYAAVDVYGQCVQVS